MLNFFLRPLRFLVQALVGVESPRQTAWGFSLGMMVGMLPKGNLTAIVLAMLLFGLRMNVAAGLLAMGLFSYMGASLDDFAHRLGAIVLLWQPGQEVYTNIYLRPWGPLTGLNNTVVMGQLLIGLYLFYPTYQAALYVAARWQPRLSKWLLQYRVIRWLRGAEWGAQWGFNS